ncbi:unnamed protein product [Trypanosoma congolense IL3000]|uniref:WGS project CAEQ00000000 data, annotated contig 799 n=1 Tax=Trypanosoma congolense (strain IL3000) TaxID=1068625 RepID=F9WII7_TRYCI|nr:unnamed protein product [Trypanosoma congolense IL3000]
MLLENSIYQQPNWAASLLWALAVAGSSQPIETARLDALFFEQLFFVTRFTEEARQAVALFGGVDASTLNEQIVSRERCIAAEATALKVSAARYKWTGALPHRDMIHLNSCVAAGGAFAAPEGVREFYLQMFRSADPSWLTALSTRIWGKVLLAVLVSNAVLGMKGARRPIQDVMEAHCFLFPNAKEEVSASLLFVPW